jgi:hypothetical protein
MYRILKVCRSAIKETEFTILNIKGKGHNQGYYSKRSNTTEESYYYNQRRKRNDIIDLVDINFENEKSCFITLTFADEAEYELAVKGFKRFTRNARRQYNNFKYVATIELQQRGAIHFHIICNIAELEECSQFVSDYWTYGTHDVQSIYDKNKLALYLTKQFIAQDKTSPLFNRRCYFVSQGLDKPYVVKSWDISDSAYNTIKSAVVDNLITRNSVTNSFSGSVNYNSYSVKGNTIYSILPNYVLAEKRCNHFNITI